MSRKQFEHIRNRIDDLTDLRDDYFNRIRFSQIALIKDWWLADWLIQVGEIYSDALILYDLDICGYSQLLFRPLGIFDMLYELPQSSIYTLSCELLDEAHKEKASGSIVHHFAEYRLRVLFSMAKKLQWT